MPDRPWQSRGQFSLPLWCYSTVRSLERAERATRHYLLFRWSIARSQVTRHCVLRALIEPVVFQVSRAVEKSPITLRVWSLMTVDSSDCAKPEEPVWFCLKVQSKREHLVASGL